MNINKKIYYLTFEDVQSIAEETIDRKLNNKELKLVEDNISNFIPWFEVIAHCIDYIRIEEEK